MDTLDVDAVIKQHLTAEIEKGFYRTKRHERDKNLMRVSNYSIPQAHMLTRFKEYDDARALYAQARRILDRLVGYKISPFLWKTVRGVLSAGRVQTVALRLVCERENAINDFVREEYWII